MIRALLAALALLLAAPASADVTYYLRETANYGVASLSLTNGGTSFAALDSEALESTSLNFDSPGLGSTGSFSGGQVTFRVTGTAGFAWATVSLLNASNVQLSACTTSSGSYSGAATFTASCSATPTNFAATDKIRVTMHLQDDADDLFTGLVNTITDKVVVTTGAVITASAQPVIVIN